MMNVDVGGGTIPRGDHSQGLMEFTPREGIIDNIDKSVENAETENIYGQRSNVVDGEMAERFVNLDALGAVGNTNYENYLRSKKEL